MKYKLKQNGIKFDRHYSEYNTINFKYFYWMYDAYIYVFITVSPKGIALIFSGGGGVFLHLFTS